MAGKRRSIPRGTPVLSGRDAELIQRFLEKHRADFLSAYLTVRESHQIAPLLGQYKSMMLHRKHQISAVDYMLSHLGDRYEFLALTEGYECDQPAGKAD